MIGEIPAWYRKRRDVAQRLYHQKKPAEHGPDIDLERFDVDVPARAGINSMYDLSFKERTASSRVGTREDEDFRSGTYFQYDRNVIYLHYTDLLKKHLPKGLIVEDTLEAIRKYSWLKNYWFRACPLNLDKYTAFVGSHETAGAFVWSQEGAKVPYPIQACLFMGTEKMVQVPHNFIIAEPESSMHLITGCTVHPECESAAHVACTEIYVKKGAEVTWTMIHAWKPQFHIRPRMGAIVEDGGTLQINYVLTTPVGSIQLYPTVILCGKDARVSFRNLLLALDKSDIDVGSAAFFSAEGARGEIVTRAVVTDQASVKMRGKLWGRKRATRGHLECRALLLSDEAHAFAFPTLQSDIKDTELSHEAAVGKIAEEQLYYLMTRGLTGDEATSLIARGFLDTEIPGLPDKLLDEIKHIVAMTAERVL